MVLPFSVESHHLEKLVIIGGGIAGLSCLNALLDNGVSPLLLEGAAIGTPKMCGEFLAPTAVALLQHWNIGPIQTIIQAKFYAKNTEFKLAFPQLAGAISRSDAEHLLAQRARKLQGTIREHARIKEIIPATSTSPYILTLDSGEEIHANSVIFATGKYGQKNSTPIPMPYYGIKVHFKHIVLPNTLLMYSLKEAYFGIVPISNEESNCTCLIRKEFIDKIGSGKQFFYQLIATNPTLNSVFKNSAMDKIDIFEGSAPEFRLKTNPPWPRALWIGDALAALHPAIGSGFSHAISSATMAAEYYLQNNSAAYLKASKQQIDTKLKLGKIMHKLMLNPSLSAAAFSFLKLNPWPLNKCLQKLEYNT